jgi:hypothetical protein
MWIVEGYSIDFYPILLQFITRFRLQIHLYSAVYWPDSYSYVCHTQVCPISSAQKLLDRIWWNLHEFLPKLFKWFRLQSGIRKPKIWISKKGMFKNPTLEPKSIQIKSWPRRHFGMLLCWSEDYFVIIRLKVVFYLFQTSYIEVFMFLKRKKILKYIEYKGQTITISFP